MVVAPQQFGIESIQIIPHQVVQCHTGMLRCTLNQPIQRVPLLNLKPLVKHGLRRPSEVAVAECRASRVGTDRDWFVADLEAVRMDAAPVQVETECLVGPEVQLPAAELYLTIVLGAPD